VYFDLNQHFIEKKIQKKVEKEAVVRIPL